MKKHVLPLIFILFCVFSTFSCHEKKVLSNEETAKNVADSFATHYFTWHFDHASRFSDDNMQHYLSFLASNVHKADLDLLLSTSTIPSINVIEINMDGDSQATAILELKDVILMDTIGEEAHLYPNAQRTLTLKKADNDEWKVSEIR